MKKLLFTLLLLGGIGGSASAKITLSPLFSEGMVLQQQSETLIWGHSDQEQVTLHCSWGARASVRVESDGYWEARITTPEGSFQKESITLSDRQEKISLKDLLIGEVWICSGQSNMYMPLRGYSGQPIEGAFESVMASSQLRDRMRMITLPKRAAEEPQRTFEGKGWLHPSPETAWGMSALAYYFAEALGQELNLPIGIISTSWGGSAIEAWMSSKDLREMGYAVEEINANPKIEERRKCSLLYNGLIAPVKGFAARGFLWYQGESNRHTADRYAEQMERMVRFWREGWPKGEEMAFYYVQIAPYAYQDATGIEAPLVMEAQREALERIPHCGMVTTIDLGEELCIHPARKRKVALRLAAKALEQSYGYRLPREMVDPAEVDCVAYNEGEALVRVKNARWGLTPQDSPILGFELAGEDGVFYPAEAEVVRSKPELKVRSARVPHPVALRYAFRNYIPSGLHNTLGQPLLPYRSDR